MPLFYLPFPCPQSVAAIDCIKPQCFAGFTCKLFVENFCPFWLLRQSCRLAEPAIFCVQPPKLYVRGGLVLKKPRFFVCVSKLFLCADLTFYAALHLRRFIGCVSLSVKRAAKTIVDMLELFIGVSPLRNSRNIRVKVVTLSAVCPA